MGFGHDSHQGYSRLRIVKLRTVMVGAVLMMVVMAMAETQRQREVLSVQGYPGQANVLRSQGHLFVDVQDLARITNGSLSFESAESF
jgi:hypothetical protein